MSGFNGRRAPNVSQYVANLNQIPNPGQEVQQDNINFQDDLEFLTNAEFFDFDQFNPNAAAPATAPFSEHAAAAAKNAQQLQYGEFQNFPGSSIASPNDGLPSPPNLQGAYPPQFSQSPIIGDKRKASIAMTTATDLEETSRMAAEEDKRRRNTAASARFRVKKKQREQALEKDNKEMKDHVQQLEGKVHQLEMENKWLKGLITDKNGPKGLDAALEANTNKDKESDERSIEKRVDGVGTESKGEEGEA